MSKLLTAHIVLKTVEILKLFPTKGGISDSLSPKTIMSGETLDFKNHLCLHLVQYYQVHDKDIPRNSQAPGIKVSICLGPSGNL